jgi:hypothetical protein
VSPLRQSSAACDGHIYRRDSLLGDLVDDNASILEGPVDIADNWQQPSNTGIAFSIFH